MQFTRISCVSVGMMFRIGSRFTCSRSEDFSGSFLGGPTSDWRNDESYMGSRERHRRDAFEINSTRQFRHRIRFIPPANSTDRVRGSLIKLFLRAALIAIRSVILYSWHFVIRRKHWYFYKSGINRAPKKYAAVHRKLCKNRMKI